MSNFDDISALQRKSRQLREECDLLQRQMERRPIRSSGGSTTVKFQVARIIGGNTLVTGQPGVKYVTSVTSVPTEYDPDVDTSFIDGIGRADYFIDGTQQTSKILIVHDAGHGTPLAFPVVQGWVGYAAKSVILTVDDDPSVTVTAYVISGL